MGRQRKTQLAREVDRQLYITGRTRGDLADFLGYKRQYLSMLLTGRTRMSIDTSERMAKFLEMDARELRELVLKKLA